MSTILKVRKTKLSEAVQINSEAEKQTVLKWLAESGVIDPDLTPLIEQGMYFLRDDGSSVVYVSPKQDFVEQFEVLGEVAPPVDHLKGFTF